MQFEVTCKAALHLAIDALEQLYYGRAGAGSHSCACPPHVNMALALVLSSALCRRTSTCFLSQTLTPTQAALRLLCLHSNVALADVASHQLQEAEFVRLTGAAGRIASSPLVFAVGESADIEQTVQHLLELARAQNFKVLVCENSTDADLASWRTAVGFFARMTGINVHLVAGRSPVACRFNLDFGQTV